MGRLMAVFRFFIYSNLFIAVCAVLMVSQTYQLLLHGNWDWNFLGFVFFSTICSYSFHWYLSYVTTPGSPREIWLKRYQQIHLVLLVIGFVGSVIFFLFLVNYWFWLLISVVVTFLYSAPKIPGKYFRLLRKVAIGKTIFLAFVWMYVTTVLPVMVTDQTWLPEFSLFSASRFFLIYAICILFDYRDREDDKAKGIRSLITYLNEKGIQILFIFSIAIFIISTICLWFYSYNVATIILLLIPGFITAGLYNYSRKNFSDALYYFTLDGLMALSSVMTLLNDLL